LHGPSRLLTRFMADNLTIPTDKEQQWGRRKIELESEAVGQVTKYYNYFNFLDLIPINGRSASTETLLFLQAMLERRKTLFL